MPMCFLIEKEEGIVSLNGTKIVSQIDMRSLVDILTEIYQSHVIIIYFIWNILCYIAF